MTPRNTQMQTTTLDCKARDWARALEEREAVRAGSIPEARRSLARRLGLAIGTFDGIRRQRTKSISLAVFERLRAAVIRDLQNEIARCSHELEIARQAGLDPRLSDMAALETAVQKANELMGKA